jgi:hypothetical protein
VGRRELPAAWVGGDETVYSVWRRKRWFLPSSALMQYMANKCGIKATGPLSRPIEYGVYIMAA